MNTAVTLPLAILMAALLSTNGETCWALLRMAVSTVTESFLVLCPVMVLGNKQYSTLLTAQMGARQKADWSPTVKVDGSEPHPWAARTNGEPCMASQECPSVDTISFWRSSCSLCENAPSSSSVPQIGRASCRERV